KLLCLASAFSGFPLRSGDLIDADTGRAWNNSPSRQLDRLLWPASPFSPDGRYLIAADPSAANHHHQALLPARSAPVYDMLSNNDAVSGPMVHTGEITAAAFIRDGRFAITLDDAVARVWDISSPSRMKSLVPGRLFAQSVFSGDGRRMVTVRRLAKATG